jgi:predicted HNH restriction endonuclease
MGKKLPTTPRSRVKHSLRRLWLQSRERASALKRDKYTCMMCNKKQSKAKGKEFKVQVHHLENIKHWERVIDMVYKEILCNPRYLLTLCPQCHKKRES